MFDLTGKVALITGSTKGIGKSIAEEMAKAGAKVVISSRKAEACEEVTRELTGKGFEAISLPCNIAHKEQLQQLVDATMKQWGKIDILVCNAAANPVYGPTAKAGDEAFDKIMGNNIKSNWWLCNMVIPQMAERKDGVVIIVSSIAALKGNTVIGLYGVSKAADTALVRNYACEWGTVQHSRQRDSARPDKDRFRPCTLGKRQGAHGTRGDDAAKAPGRARGNRRHRGVPRLQGSQFHHRPDHHRRRRRVHVN